MLIEPSSLSTLIGAIVVGFAVLGGVMAAWSGGLAATAHWGRKPPEAIAERVNRGLALGFTVGAPLGILASIIIRG